MRLSQLPNQGHIQIKDGSTWWYVKQEHWDKYRQKMLCQHLGFKETDANDISFYQIDDGRNVATGNLKCKNTQPNGTSCCIHLVLNSKTKSNVDRLSYAKCEYSLRVTRIKSCIQLFQLRLSTSKAEKSNTSAKGCWESLTNE